MEQNLLLKHRVETLEGTVASMKKEMGAVKSALGPWFHKTRTPTVSAGTTRMLGNAQSEASERRRSRTEGDTRLGDEGGGLDTASSTSGNGVERMMVTGRSSLESTSSGQTGHDATSGLRAPLLRNDGSRTEDLLAGYLPGFGEFMPAQYPGGLPGVHHPSGMGVGGLSALNGGNGQIHVAPLDVETSLVGALEGLRESVVGVAAGMDLLGRRSEIALAQETLRLSEEVISLRAGVHGLRMQVSKTLSRQADEANRT